MSHCILAVLPISSAVTFEFTQNNWASNIAINAQLGEVIVFAATPIAIREVTRIPWNAAADYYPSVDEKQKQQIQMETLLIMFEL